MNRYFYAISIESGRKPTAPLVRFHTWNHVLRTGYTYVLAQKKLNRFSTRFKKKSETHENLKFLWLSCEAILSRSIRKVKPPEAPVSIEGTDIGPKTISISAGLC